MREKREREDTLLCMYIYIRFLNICVCIVLRSLLFTAAVRPRIHTRRRRAIINLFKQNYNIEFDSLVFTYYTIYIYIFLLLITITFRYICYCNYLIIIFVIVFCLIYKPILRIRRKNAAAACIIK